MGDASDSVSHSDPDAPTGLGDRGAANPPAAKAADSPPSGVAEADWAELELGDLMARAWYEDHPDPDGDGPPGSALGTPDTGKTFADFLDDPGDATSVPVNAVEWQGGGWQSTWEVEPLPTAAEGGVAALFTKGSSEVPGLPVTSVRPSAGALVWGAGGLDTVAADDPAASSRVRLAEMLQALPDSSAPYVGVVDSPMAPTSIAVWFWGDDDIYPGKVAGTGPAASSSAGRRRHGRGTTPLLKRRKT